MKTENRKSHIQLIVLSELKQSTETGKWHWLHANFDVADQHDVVEQLKALPGICGVSEVGRYSLAVKVGKAFESQTEQILHSAKTVLLSNVVVNTIITITAEITIG